RRVREMERVSPGWTEMPGKSVVSVTAAHAAGDIPKSSSTANTPAIGRKRLHQADRIGRKVQSAFASEPRILHSLLKPTEICSCGKIGSLAGLLVFTLAQPT